jgi:hypothetical protein
MSSPRPLLHAAFALPFVTACFAADPVPLGTVEVETQGDVSIEEGIGSESFLGTREWSVTFERFLVHVGAAGLGETSASAVPLGGAPYVLVDQVLPGTKVIVTASDVVARRWGGVTFTVNPARVTSNLAGGATEEDRRAMQQKGASFRVKGVARSSGGEKRFDWWMLQVISYGDCASTLPDAGTEAGLLVKPAVRNDVPLIFSARPLFDPLLGAHSRPGVNLRFDAFADADTDSDGAITEAELRRVRLAELRATPGLEPGAYENTQSDRPLETLWDFVSEQVRHTVRFGPLGTCESRRLQ